jgi:hypothetical protein
VRFANFRRLHAPCKVAFAEKVTSQDVAQSLKPITEKWLKPSIELSIEFGEPRHVASLLEVGQQYPGCSNYFSFWRSTVFSTAVSAVSHLHGILPCSGRLLLSSIPEHRPGQIFLTTGSRIRVIGDQRRNPSRSFFRSGTRQEPGFGRSEVGPPQFTPLATSCQPLLSTPANWASMSLVVFAILISQSFHRPRTFISRRKRISSSRSRLHFRRNRRNAIFHKAYSYRSATIGSTLAARRAGM